MFNNNNFQPPQIRVTEHKTEYLPKTGSLTEGIRNRPETSRVSRWWIWIIAVVAGLIVLGALFLYFHSQQQLKALQKNLTQQQSDPNVKAKEEAKQLIDEVGKLIILPADETPTIATVSDLSKLRDQPFFANAQIGDKVLIYSKAQKAILYRPSEYKIIELAPLTSGATAPATAPASAPTNPTP